MGFAFGRRCGFSFSSTAFPGLIAPLLHQSPLHRFFSGSGEIGSVCIGDIRLYRCGTVPLRFSGVTVQVRNHWHSAELQRFFTHRTHKKVCPSCGKRGPLLQEACVFCGETLLDDHIRPTGRDPLLDALLRRGSNHDSGEFKELRRSFEVLVLRQQLFPAGRFHLLSVPTSTCYDLRQIRRKHLPVLRQLRAMGLDCLKELLGLPQRAPEPVAICGFSYPADYNQVHMHIIMPPFRNLAVFDRRVFYPYAEVESDAERRGTVRPHPVGDLDIEDNLLSRYAELDQRARNREAKLSASGAGCFGEGSTRATVKEDIPHGGDARRRNR
eukprot:TRINITY_DN17322_c0_g2_i1.p1 TRINITY_DN17322_c0_g2~~TRINITY_DN17322_c0_g2_i1.p1  ORF type:complete len:326 (+),score=19.52 TRINITY_DN17322_c0_g2_i1:102-1079(+)